MKLLISTTLILLSSIGFSQCYYKISGAMLWNSIHTGGQEPLPEPYKILANHHMFVVKINEQDSSVHVVDEVVSDSMGGFEIFLPEGLYGFVEYSDTANLAKYQYVPTGFSSMGGHTYHSLGWSLEWSTDDQMNWGPIRVSDKPINFLSIKRDESSGCLDCP